MAGHAVEVEAASGSYAHPKSAFVIEPDGSLMVWREDGTEMTVYPPGQWQRVSATGTGLIPDVGDEHEE